MSADGDTDGIADDPSADGRSAGAGPVAGTGAAAAAANDKARLRWKCRRGMRELDQAMLAYLDHHWDAATEGERHDFETLLDKQEPELYALVCGRGDEPRFRPVIDKIAATLGGPDRALPTA